MNTSDERKDWDDWQGRRQMNTETPVGTRPMPELPESDRPVLHLQAILMANELDGRADAISHMPTMRNLEDCLRRAARMTRLLIGVKP